MVDETSPSEEPREQRVQEMRQRILTAAAAVFSRKGFHKARTKEIASEAGVAEGTIYNYFPSKRDLLLAMLHSAMVPSLLDILSSSVEMDTRTILTSMLRDRLALFEHFQGIGVVLLTELMTDEELRTPYLREVIAPQIMVVLSTLGKRVGQRRERPLDLSVVLPALVGGAVFSMAAQRFLPLLPLPAGAGSLTPDQFIDQLVDFFLLGLEGRPADVGGVQCANEESQNKIEAIRPDDGP